MARRSNASARITSLLASLSPAGIAAVAAVAEQLAVANANEDIGDVEHSTRAERRKARAAAKAKAEAKPARGTRTSRRAKDEDDEKPTRATRRGSKAAEDEDEKPARRPRRAKVEAFDGDVTVDDLYDVLDNFEGEPVAGGVRELKPMAEAYGIDVAALYEAAEAEAGGKLSTADKANELGVIIAACKHLEAKIVSTLKEDAEAMDEIIEELELEFSERASDAKVAKGIIEAINAGDDAADEDEDDADDEDGEDDEDEEEEVAPRRRRSARAEKEEKPARSSRRSRKNDDDLSDLDDLDD